MHGGLMAFCENRVHLDREVREEVVRLGQHLFERVRPLQRLGEVRVGDREVGGGEVIHDSALPGIPGLDELAGDGGRVGLGHGRNGGDWEEVF